MLVLLLLMLLPRSGGIGGRPVLRRPCGEMMLWWRPDIRVKV